jgi:hypothetical protein
MIALPVLILAYRKRRGVTGIEGWDKLLGGAWQAARIHHFTASTESLGTPSPLRCIHPRSC